MVEYPALRMSVFVDCNSQALVMRVPYELAVEMIKNCPECPDKNELANRVRAAAGRSRKLTELLREKGV
ncbi:MAG: hypothetical protein IJ668_04625 [Selenomonadaceae bacterium]|nr:hypothetical protein [Selenomonadaceae bacterium]